MGLLMKTADVLYALIAFGCVVGLGLVVMRKAHAATGAGGPNVGGSYFTPEQQSEWAVPDNQLPEWGNL